MTDYRVRVLAHIVELLKPLGTLNSALDFGSGDGFFASQWSKNQLIRAVTAVDVVERPASFVVPTLYDGERLPYNERQFDIAYAIDVLHHCPDPSKALADMLRCANRYVLIKDHTYRTSAGKLALGVLDELGNRRFGIPSPYLYQKEWAWATQIEAAGWRRMELHHPLRCHTGLLGAATNSLQFIGLWARSAA
jgi:SAM-dependent methyltransferase